MRSVASSFAQAAITMNAPAVPISLQGAQEQHRAYVDLLRSILGPSNVLKLPADDSHPGERQTAVWVPAFCS